MTKREERNQLQREYRQRKKRDKKLAELKEIRARLGLPRRGIDSVTDALVSKALMKGFAKEGRLWSPTIAKSFSKVERLLDISFKASLDELMGRPLSEAVRKALRAISIRNRLRGISFEDIVLLALEMEFRNNTFCNIDRQVWVGDFRYDCCYTIDGRVRGDIEVSLEETSKKFYSDILRHEDEDGEKKFFYQIVRGYGLYPKLVDRMLKMNCQPVVTVGTSCGGPISFDEMVTEIKNKTKEEVAKRIKAQKEEPGTPASTVV
jgi:hypothetical protein